MLETHEQFMERMRALDAAHAAELEVKRVAHVAYMAQLEREHTEALQRIAACNAKLDAHFGVRRV